jgi:hypothetical protein
VSKDPPTTPGHASGPSTRELELNDRLRAETTNGRDRQNERSEIVSASDKRPSEVAVAVNPTTPGHASGPSTRELELNDRTHAETTNGHGQQNERSDIVSTSDKRPSEVAVANRPADPYDDLPFYDRFGRSRLVLMPRDPWTIFAYWEIDWCRRGLIGRHFQTDYDALGKQLRLYDVTDMIFDGHHAHETRAITLANETDSYYIYDVKPARNYVAHYGVITQDGRFFPILRSNVITLPPAGPTATTQKTEPKNLITPTIQEPAWVEQFTGYTLDENNA